jgi:hypothetical protein
MVSSAITTYSQAQPHYAIAACPPSFCVLLNCYQDLELLRLLGPNYRLTPRVCGPQSPRMSRTGSRCGCNG